MVREEQEKVHVIVNTAYYQGNRVVEGAQCGHCLGDVYEDEKKCTHCNFLLDWDNEQESEHGNFMAFYN